MTDHQDNRQGVLKVFEIFGYEYSRDRSYKTYMYK